MKLSTHIERFSRQDRAVSPVIGVILMVAITVILAAVIGTFVLDLGQTAGNSAPSASLTVSTDNTAGNITIAHQGGDSLVASNTRLTVTNESNDDSLTFEPSGDETFSVGNEIVINATASTATIGSSGDVWAGTSASTGFAGVNSGTQYSVQIIDIESQRVIFETTITA